MSVRQRFLCRLLGHRPCGEPVWNQGIYFTTCTRCARDVVRISGEAWHVPVKSRVVWSAAPPRSARHARLARETGGSLLQAWTDLPRHTRISGETLPELREGMQSRRAVNEERRSAIPDFMDDPASPLLPESAKAAEVHQPAPRTAPSRPVRVA